MQPILFILGIRPCLEAILLLEHCSTPPLPALSPGGCSRIPVRDGVRAWDFDCALSLAIAAACWPPQNRYQILFAAAVRCA